MARSGRHGSNRMFLNFLATYALVLVIPLVIGAFSYTKYLKALEQNAVEKRLSQLSHSELLISQRLLEADNILEQLTDNISVKRILFLADPYSGKNTYLVRQSMREIPDYTLTNAYLLDYYVYAQAPQLLFKQSRVYFQSEFKEDIFYTAADWESLEALFFQDYVGQDILPAAAISMRGRDYNVVTAVKSLGAPNRMSGSVLLFLREEILTDVLESNNIGENGWAFIVDDNGQVISAEPRLPPQLEDLAAELAQSGRTEALYRNIGGEDMLLTMHVSQYNSWRYVSVQPRAAIFSQADYLRRYTLSLLGLAFLIGVMISYCMAYHNTKPLRAIMGIFSTGTAEIDRPDSGVYGYIQSNINRLISDREHLTRQMTLQQPYLHSAFLERLLRGHLTDSREIAALASQLGLELREGSCVVIVANFRRYALQINADMLRELEQQKLVLQEIMRGCCGELSLLFHNVERSKLACILLLKEAASYYRLEEQLAQISVLAEENGLDLVWGAGKPRDSLLEISRSFYEADYQSNFTDRTYQPVESRGCDFIQEEAGYSYPDEVEHQLIGFARAGNKDGIRDIFRKLYWDNFHSRNLSADMQRLLLCNMCATLRKLFVQQVVTDIRLSSQMNGLLNTVFTKEFDFAFLEVLSFYETVCTANIQSHDSYRHNLAENIVEFIRGHYQEPDLSLTRVAGKFHVSEAYLSQFFKEWTGENFSTFVESLRLEHAKQLLRDTGKTIRKISQECGYSSDSSFCRAFKRVVYVSPLEYRKTSALHT